RAEDVSVVHHERAEQLERLFRLARYLFQTIDRLFRAINDVRHTPAAPTRAHAVEQFRGLLRRGVYHRRRSPVEVSRRDRLRFHAPGDLVDEFEALVLLREMFALVETDQPDDALHVVRIAVAGRRLIDEARFLR